MIEFFNEEISDQIGTLVAATLDKMTHEQLNQLYFDVSGENLMKQGLSKQEITELLMERILIKANKPLL